MAEIKRPPLEDIVAFDENHTINDILRWLVAENSYEEVLYCLENLE